MVCFHIPHGLLPTYCICFHVCLLHLYQIQYNNLQLDFDSYPIAKHLYVAGLFLTGVLTTRKYFRNSQVVKQIFLMEGGKASEIVFRNQTKRKLFGQPASQLYYNSLFSKPPENELDSRLSNELPKELLQIPMQQMVGPYWVKSYSNDKNILLIPKKFKHMDRTILQEVMQGKVILT